MAKQHITFDLRALKQALLDGLVATASVHQRRNPSAKENELDERERE